MDKDRQTMLDLTTCTAITKVVTNYIEGMCQNDPDKLRSAMHPGCSIIGHFDGGLEWDTRDDFIAVVDKAVTEPDPTPWYAIRSISVAGDVATFRSRISFWAVTSTIR
jgi:hypothetical protein